jgi:uncharacterized protein YicC (UPF0701 family)
MWMFLSTIATFATTQGRGNRRSAASCIVESAHQATDASVGIARQTCLWPPPLRLPDVTNVREADEDTDAVVALLKRAIEAAVDMLLDMRVAGGRPQSHVLSDCADTVHAAAGADRNPCAARRGGIRAKLDDGFQTLVGTTKGPYAARNRGRAVCR